jgi:3-oxoadipate enol-lactonase
VRRRRAGDGDARRAPELTPQPPVLLIPGLGQGAWAWRWVEPLLSPGRRVIAVDHRGTGSLHDLPARASIDELAADALAGVDEPVDLVGLSMGGYIALTVALGRPDLVRSLVLAGTGAGGPDRVPRPAHVAAAFTEALGLPYDEFTRVTLPYAFRPGWATDDPERFEQVVAVRLERPASYATIEAHAEACYGFYSAGVEVERIEAPALVVHGTEDVIVPVENGRRLAARLPNAEYLELEGAGHNLPLEDPEGLAAIVLEFLDR